MHYSLNDFFGILEGVKKDNSTKIILNSGIDNYNGLQKIMPQLIEDNTNWENDFILNYYSFSTFNDNFNWILNIGFIFSEQTKIYRHSDVDYTEICINESIDTSIQNMLARFGISYKNSYNFFIFVKDLVFYRGKCSLRSSIRNDICNIKVRFCE